MFLHSGASLHGHEYSNHDRRAASPQHVNRRPTLLRSALTAQKHPAPTRSDGSRPGALQPPRPASEHIAHTPEEQAVCCREQEKDDVDEGVEMAEDEEGEEDEPKAPMNADPRPLSGPDFGNLSQSSETASTITSSRRRRAVPRRTTYVLAHPPPGRRRLVVQKVIPKMYLQLQRISTAKRPMPCIDVFPSARIAGPVIAPRVAKRFPRVFGAKGGLGSDDVVLMQSEDYDGDWRRSESEEEEHGSSDQRRLLAVFSPLKKSGLTEIVLDDGSVWVARQLPTGSFDFVHEDAHGNTTTARWVRRAATRQSADGIPQALHGSSAAPEPKYTFSVINPLSRRHPVMATLTHSALDIQSHYTTVSASSSRYPPARSRSPTVPTATSRPRPRSCSDSFATSPLRRSVVSTSDPDGASRTILPPETESERTTHPVDDATKMLISVTAIWLALRSGWSPYYKSTASQPVDHNSSPSSSNTGPHPTGSPATTPAKLGCRRSWNRRGSLDESSSIAPSLKELPDSSPIVSPRCANETVNPNMGSAIRPRSGICSRDQSPAPSASAHAHPLSHHPKSLPRRATSTGAAFMQRHIQLHSPEASDTEHAAPAHPGPGIRRKGRGRILSGDWAPSLGRIGSSRRNSSRCSNSGPLALQGRIPSLRAGRDPPVPMSSPLSRIVGGPLAGQATMITEPKRPDRDRRVRSACYPSGSMGLVSPDGEGDGMVLEAGVPRDHAPGPPKEVDHGSGSSGPEDDTGRGVAGRLRSFGNWFRRLGPH